MALQLGAKRGQYKDLHNINAEYSPTEGYFIKKVNKPNKLKDIDKERNSYNKIIRQNRNLMLKGVKGEDRTAQTRWINQQAFGTKFKKGTAIEKPKDINQKAINEMREAYKKRKPLDAQSNKLRKSWDTSLKQYEDAKRYAEQKKKKYILINNERVYFSEIEELKRPELVKINGKEQLVNTLYEIRVPNVFNGRKDAKFATTISNKKYKESVIVSRTTKVRAGTTDAIIFKADESGRIYTETNMQRLIDNAKKKTGQAIIYINNYPMSLDMFRQEGKRWYILEWINPQATLRLSIPPNGGQVARYSYTYSIKYSIINAELKKTLEEESNVKHVYSEFTTNATIGERNYVVHLIIMDYNIIKDMNRAMANYYATNGDETQILAVAITKFKILNRDLKQQRQRLKELSQKPEILLTPKEKAELKELRELANIDLVIECYASQVMTPDELRNLQNKDEYVVLAPKHKWGEKGFLWGMEVKSPAFGVVGGTFIRDETP